MHVPFTSLKRPHELLQRSRLDGGKAALDTQARRRMLCRSYLILRIAWRQVFGDGQAEDVRED